MTAASPAPRGWFITFEGAEGAGKSTQIDMLARSLRARGHVVQTSREPGGTAAGIKIRTLLLDPQARLVPRSELLLYAADRAQHVDEIVRPALASGCVLLCDRHADSLVAYQAYGRGIDLQLVEDLNRIATAGLVPDLTLLLDLEPEVGLARAAQRSTADRLEREDLAFHRRVREGFLAIARARPERVHLVPAAAGVEAVHRQVLAVVEKRLDISS